MIVTSNKPFGRWGEVFGDPVVAAAINGLPDVVVRDARLPIAARPWLLVVRRFNPRV